MKDKPFLFLLIFYISGIIFGSYVYIKNSFVQVIIIINLVILIFSNKKSNLRFLFITSTILIYIFFGILSINSYLRPVLKEDHIINYISDEKLSIEGVLFRPPEYTENGVRLYIKAKRIYREDSIIHTRGKLLIYLRGREINLRYGNRVRILVRLRIPENYDNLGGFNYRRYLATDGIYVIGSLKDGRGIVKLYGNRGNIFLRYIDDLRERIRNVINSNLKEPANQIINALIVGESKGIPEDLRERFNITGTSHILAISGLHIGIIATFAFIIIKWLLKRSPRLILKTDVRRISAILSLFPIWIYGFLSGYSISTIRAIIMISAYLFSIILRREREIFNTLAFAGFIILLIYPLAIYDISFQLSFISVLSIIYLFPKIKPDLHRYKILNPILISLVAIIGTAPLVSYYFNRISIIAPLSNLIVVPLIGFLSVPIGLLASLLYFVYAPPGELLLRISGEIVSFSLYIINILSSFKFSSLRVTTPNIIEIILFYAFIILIFNIKRAKWVKYGVGILFFIIIGNYIYIYYSKQLNNNLRVTFIDVGQGESIFIEFPGGKNMLIDGGGAQNFDVGERIVAPFLWKRRIKKVDYILLSHPHPDHFKGLLFITKNFKVKEFLRNGYIVRDPQFIELEDIIKNKGIKERVIDASTRIFYINGVKIEIFNPVRAPTLPYDDEILNNDSVVVKLTYKRVSFLFTGDIGIDRESELVDIWGDRLSSDILKVAHHGSRLSSSERFIETVGPRIAVISVGLMNVYGFPNKRVIKRLKDIGAIIYRTDVNGAVTIRTNGEIIKVKTAKQ